MKLLRRFAELTFDNPLLRHRLRQRSAYTLTNLWLMLALVLMLAGGGLRFVMFLARYRVSQGLPGDFPTEYRALVYNSTWNTYFDPYLNIGPEGFASFIQCLGYLMLFLPLPWRLFRDACGIRPGGTPVFAEDVRMTPLTPGQVFAARIDWFYFKLGAILLLNFPLLLLPYSPMSPEFNLMPRLPERLYPYMSYGDVVAPNWMLIVVPQILWIAAFALHRWIWLFRAAGWKSFRKCFRFIASFLFVSGIAIIAFQEERDIKRGSIALIEFSGLLVLSWIWVIRRYTWRAFMNPFGLGSFLITVAWIKWFRWDDFALLLILGLPVVCFILCIPRAAEIFELETEDSSLGLRGFSREENSSLGVRFWK